MNVGVGLSTEKNPALAVKEALRSATYNLASEKIDLAIVFSSINFSSVNLLKALSISLGEVPLLGCSSAAIISNQGIFKHGLVIMLLSFSDNVYFNTACVRDIKTKGSLNAGRELGEQLGYGFRNVRRCFGVVFSDGLIDDCSGLLCGMQERLGRSLPLVGASASDDMRFLKTYLYFNRELLSDAAAGILWGGKLNFGLGLRHGWKGLGKPHTVTKSEGNIIYEIDERPAAMLYEEYLAKNIAELRQEIKRISMLYPIGIDMPQEEECILRNVLSIGDSGSLRLQGNITEGSSIKLMIGTKESCLAATRKAVEEAKKLSSSPMEKSGIKNFILVFNSASRYMLLRRDAPLELEIIKEGFGKNTPVIGLYTYGEQAPLRAIRYQGQAYFHNQAIAILNVGG
ncbi:MAG: FIST N-terminal domain-containing protein [Candidatus Omnitrophica bacterium]|nr:FIST N-terminal domain-containing protein [Candidatus Omnitrophota bacterium]MDD5592066.1 FIST N-terminal domain-containing protein [Candidatus Omnitrophota bacterium]